MKPQIIYSGPCNNVTSDYAKNMYKKINDAENMVESDNNHIIEIGKRFRRSQKTSVSYDCFVIWS